MNLMKFVKVTEEKRILARADLGVVKSTSLNNFNFHWGGTGGSDILLLKSDLNRSTEHPL